MTAWKDGNATLDVDSAALTSIGFNSQEEHGVHSYHVQTEVSVRDRVIIKTLVARQGHVLDMRTTGVLRDEQKDESAVRRIAERQHAAVLAEVKRGRYDAL